MSCFFGFELRYSLFFLFSICNNVFFNEQGLINYIWFFFPLDVF
jgi:hypothetical protein